MLLKLVAMEAVVIAISQSITNYSYVLSRYTDTCTSQGSPCVWHLGNVFAFRSMGSKFLLKTMVWKKVF